MAQTVTIQAAGLMTNLNELAAPDGALTQADNVVIDRAGSLELFRGQGQWSPIGFGGDSMIDYNGYIWVSNSADLSYVAFPLTAVGSGTLGSDFSPYGSGVMAFAKAMQKIYLQTSFGLCSSASPTTAPALAGSPRALDNQGSLAGTSGFMLGDTQVAYRVVWGLRDTLNNIILGSPSPREVVQNPLYSIAVGGLSKANGSTTVVATTASAHGYAVGQTITVTLGGAETYFVSGTFTIAATPSGTTFTYVDAVNNGTGIAQLSTNTSTIKSAGNTISLAVRVPPGLTTSFFCQVYRSVQSASQTTEPSDELGLVYETSHPGSVAATQYTRVGTTVTVTATAHGYAVGQWINAGTGTGAFPAGKVQVVTVPGANSFTYTQAGSATTESGSFTVTPETILVTDITPDGLIGTSLYTNESQEGILQANEQAPHSYTLAAFRDCLFAGNIVYPYRKTLQLLGVGSPNGLQSGDTFTVAFTGLYSVTFTAASSESLATHTFKVYTSGTASQNIANTARSLVRAINYALDNYNTSLAPQVLAIAAAYVSGPNDAPGLIAFQTRPDFGGGGNTGFASSRGGTWNPVLPVTASYGTGDRTTTIADTYPNGVAYSKQGQPESWPILNFILVGAADKRVVGLTPLVNSLIVWKEDGVFRITGDDPTTFRVDTIDASVRLEGRGTCAMSGRAWGYTNLGIVAVSENGVEIVSHPINRDVVSAIGAVPNDSFMAAHESDQKIYLFLNGGTSAYVFNTATRTWTTRSFPGAPSSAIAPSLPAGSSESEALYVSFDSADYLMKENRTFTSADYVDFFGTITLTSVVGTTLNGTGHVVPEVGDVIRQGNKTANVVSLSNAGETIVVDATPGFTTTTASIDRPISYAVKWAPFTGQNPGAEKIFREVAPIYAQAEVTTASLDFSTEVSPSPETVTITPGNTASQFVRAPVPQEKARGEQLSVKLSGTSYKKAMRVNGLAVTFEVVSEKASR